MQNRPLSLDEAKQRVRRAVDAMEKIINEINNTPGMWDPERREYLSEQCWSFLEEEFGQGHGSPFGGGQGPKTPGPELPRITPKWTWIFE